MDKQGREVYSKCFGSIPCPKCFRKGYIKIRQMGGFRGVYVDHRKRHRYSSCYIRKATPEERGYDNKKSEDRLKLKITLMNEAIRNES